MGPGQWKSGSGAGQHSLSLLWEGADVSQRRGLGDWLTKGTPGAVPARCSDSRAGWSGEGSGCGREGRDGVGDGEGGAN